MKIKCGECQHEQEGEKAPSYCGCYYSLECERCKAWTWKECSWWKEALAVVAKTVRI